MKTLPPSNNIHISCNTLSITLFTHSNPSIVSTSKFSHSLLIEIDCGQVEMLPLHLTFPTYSVIVMYGNIYG